MKNTAQFIALLAALSLIAACGSSTSTTSTSDTVTISGSASVTDVSASIGAKSLSKSTVEGLTCKVFTMEGEEVLSATSGTDGAFSGDGTLADLKPGSETGTSWEEELICECKNDSGSIYVARYAEVEVDESSTTTISCGTLTREGMLAVESVIDELDGCDPREATECTPPEGKNLRCVFDADLSTWEEADRSADGISDDFAFMRDMMFAAQDAGLAPEDIREDFDHWGDCADAVRDGDLTDAEEDIIIAEITELFGISEAEARAIFDEVPLLDAKKKEILEEHVYGTDNALATAAANETVAEGATTEEDPCPTGDEMDAFVAPFMHADDLADMEDTFDDPRVWAQMEDMLDNVDDGDFDKFRGEHGDVVHAFLDQHAGTFDDFEGDDLFSFMNNIEDDMDVEDLKEAAHAYHQALDQGLLDDDTHESARNTFFGEIFVDDFDFEEDFDGVEGSFDQVEQFFADHEDFDFSECEALSPGSAEQQACFEEKFGDEVDFGDHGDEGHEPGNEEGGPHGG